MVKFLKTFQLFGILDPETHARATVEVWAVHMCSGLGFQKKCPLSIFESFGESKGHQPVSRSSDLILPNFPDVTNANGKLKQDAWGKVGQTKQKMENCIRKLESCILKQSRGKQSRDKPCMNPKETQTKPYTIPKQTLKEP